MPPPKKTKPNRELENFREGEIREMIDIYVERGMEPDDAEVRSACMCELFWGGRVQDHAALC